MTRTRLAAILFAVLAPLGAQGGPVVVELFTSQGCSSCPPADEYLGRIAEREDVIPLSLHVDYWDYLGWRDLFGRPENTERQQRYAKYLGERMVYTPQIIVQGREGMVGSHRDEVEQAIARAAALPETVTVTLERRGPRLHIALVAKTADAERCAVQLVWYARAEPVEIAAGENAGRRFVYNNVVKGWSELGVWGGGGLTLEAPTPKMADGVAVLVQDLRHGHIVAAQRLALR